MVALARADFANDLRLGVEDARSFWLEGINTSGLQQSIIVTRRLEDIYVHTSFVT